MFIVSIITSAKEKLCIIHHLFLHLHLHLLGDGLGWAPRTCRSSRPSACTTEDFVPGKHCPVDGIRMKRKEGDMQGQMKNQQTHPLGWDYNSCPGFWKSVSHFDVRPGCEIVAKLTTTAQGYQTTIQQRYNHWPHDSAPFAPRNNPRGTHLPWKHSMNKLSPNRT